MTKTNEKQAILDELSRISGRLKTAAFLGAVGRDEVMFDIMTDEIFKLDELEHFITHLFSQEIEEEANTKLPIVGLH